MGPLPSFAYWDRIGPAYLSESASHAHVVVPLAKHGYDVTRLEGPEYAAMGQRIPVWWAR